MSSPRGTGGAVMTRVSPASRSLWRRLARRCVPTAANASFWSAIARSCARRILAVGIRTAQDMTTASFWQTLRVRYWTRQPFWFTDQEGVTLRLYPDDCLNTILHTKRHFDDPSLLGVMRELLPSARVVIDVGANYGQFTVFAAHRLAGRGHVHSFEPATYTFGRLSENVARLGDLAAGVHLNRSAVGQAPGQAVLYEFPNRHSAWNSLSPHEMWAFEKRIQPCRSEDVPVVSLDQYCAEQRIEHIDVLKIDVEGFELDVLRGCRRLVQEGRIVHLVFEISVRPLRGAGHTADELLGEVAASGFDVRYIRPGGSLEPVTGAGFVVPDFGNYLATLRTAR